MNEDFVKDKGFVLLPWRFMTKDGIPFNRLFGYYISIYTVLRSFIDKNGMAYPSIATLAVYSGISKEHVLFTLNWLSNSKIIKITKGKPNKYKMVTYSESTKQGYKKSDWFSIPRSIIRSGIWAILPPSAKRLYLMLQAMSYPGVYDDNKGYDLHFNDKGEDLYVDYEYRKECEEEFPYTVIPWSKLNNVTYDTGAFIKLCGIESSRTYRDARSRLTKLGLIRAGENGLYLPYREHGVVSEVLARVDEIKKQSKVSASTKRFAKAVSKGQKRTDVFFNAEDSPRQ